MKIERLSASSVKKYKTFEDKLTELSPSELAAVKGGNYIVKFRRDAI